MSDVRHLGPLAYRRFVLEKTCAENVGHTHNYDHVTFVQRGGVEVYYRAPGGEEQKHPKAYRAGDFFLVPARLEHRIKALEPDTVYSCVFSHRDFGGEVIQSYGPAASEAAYV